MNDRHKFRVWRTYSGGEGFYLTDEEGMCLWSYGELWKQDDCTDISDSCVVEFCTGIEDKNGKLIWEGDIVQGIFQWGAVGGPIAFKDGCFCLDYVGCTSMHTPHDILFRLLEVVGNIHENPDLLEAKDA